MCNDCGCQDNVHSNQCCNIVACGSVAVTQEWNDTIVCAPNVEVISPDNSISVNKVTSGNDITFEIEKECCVDNKVGSCPSDTQPGYLFDDKLRVDTTGPLTYDLVNCPWDGYVQIGFDVNQLNVPDKKVAVDASCEWKYLSDALKSFDPYFNFEISNSGCNYLLIPQPRKLLRAEIYNNVEHVITLTDGVDEIYGMNHAYMQYTANLPWAANTISVGGNDVRTITVPKTGWYQINMQGSYILSGVHTIRNQICDVIDYSPILDSREEGGWRVDTTNNLIDTQDELNTDISMAMNADVKDNDGKEMSISTFMRGHWFGGSVAKYLTAGTTLVMLHKLNTRTKNNYTDSPETTVVFSAKWFNYSSNWEAAGTGRSIVELPEYTLSN